MKSKDDACRARRAGRRYPRHTAERGLVCIRVGVRPGAICRLISEGRFPKQVQLSERTSAWVASEIETYMDARIAERDAKRPAAAEGRF